MGIFAFLLAITIVIGVHEFGHYLACRLFGISVEKFAIGVGTPILKRVDRKGTEWSLRPLPLGGFVQPDTSEMENATPFAKFIVAIFGPLANLAPFILIAAWFGKLGSFISAMWTGYVTGITSIFNILTFGFFVTPTPGSGGSVMGPIGIASASVDLVEKSNFGMTFAIMVVALSLGVALINLIPIPTLDGGRAVMACIEAVIGRGRAKKVETIANGVGIIILIALFLIITTRDILNLF